MGDPASLERKRQTRQQSLFPEIKQVDETRARLQGAIEILIPAEEGLAIDDYVTVQVSGAVVKAAVERHKSGKTVVLFTIKPSDWQLMSVGDRPEPEAEAVDDVEAAAE